jgi:probable DNA metabolism protein
MRTVEIDGGFSDFRTKAAALAREGVRPRDVAWREPYAEGATLSMFSDENHPQILSGRTITVTPGFLRLAEAVAHSNANGKWDLLYRLLFRLTFENRKLLEVLTDDDVKAALDIQKKIKREVHKIHAFVRFERIEDASEPAGERFVAWMKTDHPCLKLAAPFFKRRFGDRSFSIFTPYQSAHWDRKELTYADGMPSAPTRGESMDELWKGYYKSTFNPARMNIPMMKKELPVRYWNALPEAQIIRDLIQESPERLKKMARNQNVRATPPETKDLGVIDQALMTCTACPLYKTATHAVMGAGPAKARIMIVGEQPGDSEDLEGKPFVGPAGQMLDGIMQRLGLERSQVYVTNAVKHFKWKAVPGSKTRIHQRASGAEMHACKPWLEREIEAIQPEVIICLGATAAQTIFGRVCKISEFKDRVITDNPYAPNVLVSYHPSAILRASDPSEKSSMEDSIARALQHAQAIASKKN